MSPLLTIDLPAVLTASCVAATCAVLGTFLLLRRASLLGDAVSHSVMPGLVAAFILTQSRDPLAMFVGGASAGLAAALLAEVIRRHARTDAGTAMGVVFPVAFAVGIVMLRYAESRGPVDLDADCVLFGELSRIIWAPPPDAPWLSARGLAALPRELVVAAAVLVVSLAAVGLMFKELTLASFDESYAHAAGLRPGWVHAGLIALTACAVVSAFEAVGSILVIALLICPPAAARMFTDRLRPQIAIAAGFGVASAVLGYILAGFAPGAILGIPSLSPSGMIAACSGVFLAGAILAAPGHGLIARRLRRLALAVRIAHEDLLATLYRANEGGPPHAPTPVHPPMIRRLALRRAGNLGHVTTGSSPSLTSAGAALAGEIVRSHRLWERFLVDRAGLRPDQVHAAALDLEHVRRGAGGDRLVPDPPDDLMDPHDRPIPSPPQNR
ncbi:MAG: metal ABC transporter permease [Phycisphaeraceae bacterium]|nr:MAG: metal ABC transporter permease [Phycisphaeraceae bacterium]